jgi:hypothetical protein
VEGGLKVEGSVVNNGVSIRYGDLILMWGERKKRACW